MAARKPRRVLGANVVLRHGSDIVTLLAGDEVPAWAKAEVGDHVLVADVDGDESVADVDPGDESAEAE